MKVGITERGDAGLMIKEWEDKIDTVGIAILITKHLTDDFIQAITRPDIIDKIIVHVTCTGYGGTKLEPGVRTKEWTHEQVLKAQDAGFNGHHMVLRVDPIIPTHKGICNVSDILQLFSDTDICRMRYSFLQMYPHAVERFKTAGVRLPYESFNAPQGWQDECTKMLITMHSGRWSFESCATKNEHRIGCVSDKDYSVLMMYDKVNPFRSAQRPGCLCSLSKTELLSTKGQCASGCLYCYWKNRGEA